MGRHYPNLSADPVTTDGYYYSARRRKLARLQVGEKLPRHMGPWEFVARDDEGTSSEILQRLLVLHPELDPKRLSFTTTTPVDMQHMTALRMRRLGAYLAVAAVALGVGLLIARMRQRE